MERPVFATVDGRIGRRRALMAGAIGGLIGGIGMGIVLDYGLGLMPFIGVMVGVRSALAGWIVHLFVSAAFGTLFVPIARSGPGREMTGVLSGCLGLGGAHGAVLGLLTGGIMLPIWLRQAGETAFPAPLVTILGFTPDFDFAILLSLAHLLYGIVLGGVYGYLTGAGITPTEEPSPTAET